MVWLIVAFLVIIFVLMVVPLIPNSNLYGQWYEERGRCFPNSLIDHQDVDLMTTELTISCNKGGTRKVSKKCRPNPKSGWGCQFGGRQTFDTIITTEKCPITCVKYKWKKEEKSDCYQGKQYVTYRCRLNDETGMNSCNHTNSEGRKKTYKPNDSIVVTESCSNSIPIPKPEEVYGEWITVNPGVFDDAIGIFSDITKQERYIGTPYCKALLPLQVGKVRGKLGCLRDGLTYLGDMALKKCSEPPPKEPESVDCYKLDQSMQYGIIYDKNDYYIGFSNYPDDGKASIIPLIIRSPEIAPSCTLEETTMAMSARFYFAHVKGDLYLIVVLGPRGLVGWLEDGQWKRAKLSPSDFGKLPEQIKPYRVTFMNDRVTIREKNGNPVELRSMAGNITPVINMRFVNVNYQYVDFKDECVPKYSPTQ